MSGGVVAVIPARGGSKRLPGKNLRLVGGVSLLERAIAAAQGANRIDAACVSTDDPEIAALARSQGASVIDRPPALATDQAQNDAVVRHALETLAGTAPAVVVLLQPTSPLRNARHVDECLALFLGSDAPSAMSLCPVTHHPGKYVRLDQGLIEPFTTDAEMEARHQDLPPVFRQNGAIYAVRTGAFLEAGRFYLRPCLGYLMTPEESIDVDDDLDLAIADALAGRQ